MKIQIVKNKYINAGLLLMLVSATLHIISLIVAFIDSWDFHVFNYFTIIGVDRFVPGAFNTAAGDIVSFFFVIVLYGIILFYNEQ